MRMNKVFSVLGGIGAALLLGSFFMKDVSQDIMRLFGFVLLIVYCGCKIMRDSKDGKAK